MIQGLLSGILGVWTIPRMLVAIENEGMNKS